MYGKFIPPKTEIRVFFHRCIISHSYLSWTGQLVHTLWAKKIVSEKENKKIEKW
jgi:hypothetical protein